MKETVGAKALELLQKEEGPVSVIDQQRAMTEDYNKNLIEAVDRGYTKYKGNFFIHVEKKVEPLLPNVFRCYFIDRQTCPTPNYDQDVYMYNRDVGQIEYLWTIPDRDTCFNLKQNYLQVVEEEKWSLKFVFDFDSGKLLQRCKELNGECEDSTLLKEGN